MVKEKIGNSYDLSHERFTFTYDGNASRETKIAIKFTSQSATKGWLLTTPKRKEVGSLSAFPLTPNHNNFVYSYSDPAKENTPILVISTSLCIFPHTMNLIV